MNSFNFLYFLVMFVCVCAYVYVCCFLGHSYTVKYMGNYLYGFPHLPHEVTTLVLEYASPTTKQQDYEFTLKQIINDPCLVKFHVSSLIIWFFDGKNGKDMCIHKTLNFNLWDAFEFPPFDDLIAIIIYYQNPIIDVIQLDYMHDDIDNIDNRLQCCYWNQYTYSLRFAFNCLLWRDDTVPISDILRDLKP